MTTSGSALVIGEALIDIVETSGGASEHVGGSPANVALGLGRRGVDVTLLTQFGADPRGAAIESHLSASRVRTLVERGEASSTSGGVCSASPTCLPHRSCTRDPSPPSSSPVRETSSGCSVRHRHPR
jgi:fructokinase